MGIIKSRLKQSPKADGPKPESLAVAYSIKNRKAGSSRPMEDDASPRASSIAEAIMQKREAKKMADGGMVELNDSESDADLDSMNAEAGMKELYDDDQLSSQPENSNEIGDDIEPDAHDMVSQIRKKMMAKRGSR